MLFENSSICFVRKFGLSSGMKCPVFGNVIPVTLFATFWNDRIHLDLIWNCTNDEWMKQYHLIEIFSANCPLCKHITDDIQIGKCEGCNQIVYDMTEEIEVKMRDNKVKVCF